ncbi:metallophosphoesterase [Oenococcus oeni]|uniref:Calcineurin-like phosphoesterase n=5 Tax=Oenococcus oeni TaxID=1247 RepID=Q04DL6_OENOB|nr:metallophosphoesterase [Oenococcus oeni]KGO17080.1 metallophosphatase [Oenococcus oeni X2L]ABJ57456.1 Calcineurin-like phosphoesterase [Oenococcus oeni PSU-1]AWW99016.1 metallophosphatase [Oenococcus oeni]EFD87810.1 hypothetical protein AWRIB429_1636 [Oenococcus oeni AWRIB429]EJN92427.1 calcineurin-like phosphoesterase [Oenococcus oeni AWRIB304]
MNKFEVHEQLDKVILVSDIHENWQALKKIVDLPEYGKSDYTLVFLGDYTDANGSNLHEPIKVINFIMDQVKNHGALAIHGNHDDMLYGTAIGDSDKFFNWGNNGILETQELLGLTANDVNIELTKNELNEKYSEYIDFLDEIPYAIEDQKRLFVHAGIDWTKNNYHDTAVEDLIWIREKYFFSNFSAASLYDPVKRPIVDKAWHRNTSNKVIVAGHTPSYFLSADQSNPIVEMRNNQNDFSRYDIDGGSHSADIEAALNILILDKEGKEIRRDRLLA